MTLCIIHRDGKILLGMKKRGFGKGRWNGFGGKVEKNETVEDAARRELFEEAGIKAKDIRQVGILEFKFENDNQILETYFFKVVDFLGEPRETDEMKPRWFNEDEVPFEKMWPDDKFWMPYFLKNKKFRGAFLFDRESNENYSSCIIEKEIREV